VRDERFQSQSRLRLQLIVGTNYPGWVTSKKVGCWAQWLLTKTTCAVLGRAKRAALMLERSRRFIAHIQTTRPVQVSAICAGLTPSCPMSSCLSDRVIVLHEGRVTGEFQRADATAELVYGLRHRSHPKRSLMASTASAGCLVNGYIERRGAIWIRAPTKPGERKGPPAVSGGRAKRRARFGERSRRQPCAPDTPMALRPYRPFGLLSHGPLAACFSRKRATSPKLDAARPAVDWACWRSAMRWSLVTGADRPFSWFGRRFDGGIAGKAG
jgi:hypothetical protein